MTHAPTARALRQAALTALLAGCSGEIGGGAMERPRPAERPADPAAPSRPGGPQAEGGAGGTAPAARPGGSGGTGGMDARPAPPLEEPRPTPVPPSFTCKSTDGGGIPRRLWRLSGRQYQNSLAVFWSGRRIKDANDRRRDPPEGLVIPFATAGGADRFSSYDTPTLTDFEFRRAMETTAFLAGRFVAENRRNGGNCYTQSATPVTKGCVRQTLRERGALLFRRPLTEAELDHYDKLARDAVGTLGEDDAAALALQAFLMAPQFLFRSELGAGATTTTTKLTQHELAAAIALTLTDFPPDEPLWAAAEAGKLGTPEEIRPHVARLLAAPERTGTVTRFLREYFRYDRVLDVFKDPKEFRGHNAEALFEETGRFVEDVLATNARKGFLETLLTSDVAFVKLSNNNQDATFTYGVTTLTKNDGSPQRVQIPGQRAGILTQPSFLVGFSESNHTQPVQRGRFIAESLLCGSVPELPVGEVPPLPAETANATMRERLALHSKDACWGCHKLMDHLGLAFEIYDHVGRYRMSDGGKAIDASGRLEGTGADGAFANGLELTRRLSVSPLVEQCFVRHAFRHFFGRQEADGDGCALVAANEAYRKSGGDLVELVTALFVSKSSLDRVGK